MRSFQQKGRHLHPEILSPCVSGSSQQACLQACRPIALSYLVTFEARKKAFRSLWRQGGPMLLRALTRAQKKAYAQHKIGQWRRRTWKTTALHIDRRGHLERSWQKQKELEQKLLVISGLTPKHLPAEVACLSHLERCVEVAGSSIVVVAFYSRSCGACKQMLQHYTEICQEACSQRAGVRFLKHNVRDEFDDVTDIARLYRIKHVPCFVFFSGGAMMKSMPMPDSRLDPTSIQKLMGSQAGQLSTVLRQMLFKDTPSARR